MNIDVLVISMNIKKDVIILTIQMFDLEQFKRRLSEDNTEFIFPRYAYFNKLSVIDSCKKIFHEKTYSKETENFVQYRSIRIFDDTMVEVFKLDNDCELSEETLIQVKASNPDTVIKFITIENGYFTIYRDDEIYDLDDTDEFYSGVSIYELENPIL